MVILSSLLLIAAVGVRDVAWSSRLRLLDLAWTTHAEVRTHDSVTSSLNAALAAKVKGDTSTACKLLDEAIAELSGRQLKTEDAVDVNFESPIQAPGAAALLDLTWAYLPDDPRPVAVSVGGFSARLAVGRSLTWSIRPQDLNADLEQSTEGGFVAPVTVGDSQKFAYLSVVRDPSKRLAALRVSSDIATRTVADAATELLSASDPKPPIWEPLGLAEAFQTGEKDPKTTTLWPWVRYEGASFRVALPAEPKQAQTYNVVVAMPAQGFSPLDFFDAYGRGAGVGLALDRGWVFVAAEPSPTALRAPLAWLSDALHVHVGKVFVVAHGGGADLTLGAQAGLSGVNGVAIFGPNVERVPAVLKGIPVFLAVGKRDAFSAKAFAALKKELAGRPNCSTMEVPACEHLMIVADAMNAAFDFFDRIAK